MRFPGSAIACRVLVGLDRDWPMGFGTSNCFVVETPRLVIAGVVDIGFSVLALRGSWRGWEPPHLFLKQRPLFFLA